MHQTSNSNPSTPSLTHESVKKIYDRLMAECLEKQIEKKYSYGIIWQEISTEFCFMDGRLGYSSPYVPEKDKVYWIKSPEMLYKHRMENWWR